MDPLDPRSSFELLYDRHAHAVKAYARRRGDEATADDVVSEVFLVCWRRFQDVPAADPLPWLLGVARRVLSTQRRSQHRRAALIDRLTENAPEPPDVYANLRDGALASALGRLGKSDRELLLLIAWDGLTPAQAAVVLDAKAATVRVRLLRARRRLDRALALEDMTVLTPCPPIPQLETEDA